MRCLLLYIVLTGLHRELDTLTSTHPHISCTHTKLNKEVKDFSSLTELTLVEIKLNTIAKNNPYAPK